MAYSTSCQVYWTDFNNNVIERDVDAATCTNSALTSCTITSSRGSTLPVTCNSLLQFVDVSFDYTAYFCSCGSNAISIPSTVYCVDICYNLHTQFSKCNVLSLYDGYTSGSPSIGVQSDTCVAYRCNTQGTLCTTDGSIAYICDNKDHGDQGISSTLSYACNCAGPATIPEIYRGTSGATEGSGCGKAAGTVSVSPGGHTTTTSTSSTSSLVSLVSTSTTQHGGREKYTFSLRSIVVSILGILLFLHLY